MRRLLAIATFVLLLASVFAQAQRGSGHGFSGGHGAVAAHGSMGGHMGTARGFSGAHTAPRFSGRSFNGNSSFHQRGFARPGFRGNSRGPRFRTFNSRNCFGCRRGFFYPWAYGGYYDPYWWWDSGSSYDEDREREVGLANEMNQQNLEEQRMRREQDQDIYAHERSSDPPMRGDVQTQSFAPSTVLVFRDQHQQEVQNYAIVGQTLWAFAPQRTQKIPLADLDIAATQKANDDRGVDFHVPIEGQGQ
jgi:hypothetical protein